MKQAYSTRLIPADSEQFLLNLPVPGQQFVKALGGPAVKQGRRSAKQAAAFARLGERPVASADSDASQGALGRVVADVEPAVLEEALQRRPDS